MKNLSLRFTSILGLFAGVLSLDYSCFRNVKLWFCFTDHFDRGFLRLVDFLVGHSGLRSTLILELPVTAGQFAVTITVSEISVSVAIIPVALTVAVTALVAVAVTALVAVAVTALVAVAVLNFLGPGGAIAVVFVFPVTGIVKITADAFLFFFRVTEFVAHLFESIVDLGIYMRMDFFFL